MLYIYAMPLKPLTQNIKFNKEMFEGDCLLNGKRSL